MDLFILFCRFIVALVALKAIIIGSDFNFFYWFKYKRNYWDWYNNREEFKPKRSYSQYVETVFGEDTKETNL